MKKIPVFNCPDVLLYDYDEAYKLLYESKVFELDGLLQYCDNQNRLNEFYKKLLKYERSALDEKLELKLEFKRLSKELEAKALTAISHSYTIISMADPLSSLEFIGSKAARAYLDLFLLDFLYELQNMCPHEIRIHLCPKLSILLIRTMQDYEACPYRLEILNLNLDKVYPSLVHALVFEEGNRGLISGLKCIHFLGKTNKLTFFKLKKLHEL